MTDTRKTNEFGMESHHLFLDFKGAYYSINRDKLYSVEVTRLVKITMTEIVAPLISRKSLKHKMQMDFAKVMLWHALFNFAVSKVIRN